MIVASDGLVFNTRARKAPQQPMYNGPANRTCSKAKGTLVYEKAYSAFEKEVYTELPNLPKTKPP